MRMCFKVGIIGSNSLLPKTSFLGLSGPNEGSRYLQNLLSNILLHLKIIPGSRAILNLPLRHDVDH